MMQLVISLIRNGAAKGESSGQFLGMQDAELAPEWREQLVRMADEKQYPEVDLVYCSGLMRCRETAAILYPNTPAILMKDLRAFDYGMFAGKTYCEIVRDKQFARWAEAETLDPCPGGEEPHSFMARCASAFRELSRELESKSLQNVAVVTHKAVIKAILQRFCLPRSHYNRWDVGFGGGYVIVFDTLSIGAQIIKEL